MAKNNNQILNKKYEVLRDLVKANRDNNNKVAIKPIM
jgi:hypothetical protein